MDVNGISLCLMRNLLNGLSCLDTCFGISTAWLVVWKPLCLNPSDGVFGRFDLAALCGRHTLNVCCCCCCICAWVSLLVGGLDFIVFGSIPARQYLDMFDSKSETDHSGASSDEELVEV